MSIPKLTGIERIMALRRGEPVEEPVAPAEPEAAPEPVETPPEFDAEG